MTSKNRLLQQATERGHIELFLELARLPATVELGDRPDCILVLPNRRVGLEHRELVDESVQAHGPHLRRLEERLLAELRARALRVHAQVEFPGSYLVDHSRQMRPLARRIADLAAPSRAFGAEQLRALGMAGPRRIVFHAAEEASVEVHGGPVNGDIVPSLLAAVRSKESKLDGYARDPRISQLWLLLVAGETRAIGDLRIESRFDRVYVLDAPERKLLSVKE